MDIIFKKFCPIFSLDAVYVKKIEDFIYKYTKELELNDIDRLIIICKGPDVFCRGQIGPVENVGPYTMRLSVKTITDDEDLAYIIKHELYHIKDVKDPNFRFSESKFINLEIDHPILSFVLRGLWDIYIDKRIDIKRDTESIITDIVKALDKTGCSKDRSQIITLFNPQDICNNRYSFDDLIEITGKITS